MDELQAVLEASRGAVAEIDAAVARWDAAGGAPVGLLEMQVKAHRLLRQSEERDAERRALAIECLERFGKLPPGIEDKL